LIQDPQRYAGNAGPGPNIGDAVPSLRNQRPEEEGIEEEPSPNCRTSSQSRQVVGSIPQKEEIGIATKGLPLSCRRRSAQEGREGLEKVF